jgi:transcriptional regulator with XRE-family HTH domain
MIHLRLREVLQEKGFSQARLSRLADVSMNTIQTIYHHPHHDVALSTLERLARGLQVEIAELYEVLPEETEEEWAW